MMESGPGHDWFLGEADMWRRAEEEAIRSRESIRRSAVIRRLQNRLAGIFGEEARARATNWRLVAGAPQASEPSWQQYRSPNLNSVVAVLNTGHLYIVARYNGPFRKDQLFVSGEAIKSGFNKRELGDEDPADEGRLGRPFSNKDEFSAAVEAIHEEREQAGATSSSP